MFIITQTRTITLSSYLAMFFLGVSSALVGAAARSIGLSPYQIGLLIAVQNVGFMLAVVVTGALADTYEKPRLLFVGSLILAIALLCFYAGDVFWVNLVIMFFIGAGIGVYEGVTDAMLLDIHSQRQNYYINVNHFFVTFGSVIIALYLLFLQVNWRSSVVLSGAVVAGLALVFALTRLAPRHVRSERYRDRLRILSRQRVLLALFVATVLVVGVEITTTGVLTTFLVEARGLPVTWAQFGLVIFLLGVASGRLLVGYFARNEHIGQVILLLLVLSIVFGAVLYLLDLGRATYVAVYVAGLAMSALLPLMLTLAGLLHPDMAGTVLGALKMAIALGGIFIPLAMSLLARQISFQIALLLLPAAFLVALLVLFPTVRGVRVPGTARRQE